MVGMIEDGYTRDDGFIAEAPESRSGERLWDALEFTYRPATRLEGLRLDSEVRIALLEEDKDPECAVRAEKLACEFVAKRIVAWNLKNTRGLPVIANSDSCAKMQANLFGRIYKIIRGFETSDPKPHPIEIQPSDV